MGLKMLLLGEELGILGFRNRIVLLLGQEIQNLD